MSGAAATLRLGIIGTGEMAHAHAEAYADMPGCELWSACDLRDRELREFGAKFGIRNCYRDAQAMLADPELDAVSVVTPDSSHAELNIAALQAGKHVLCEKPLAVNYDEAKRMLVAAQESGLRNMVNLTYRNAPCIQYAREIVSGGEIGEVVHVEAKYLQSWLSSKVWGDWRSSPTWLWRLSARHGSRGVLGDIGVHILDFASYPLCEVGEGSEGGFAALGCTLKTFEEIKGRQLGEYSLDANDSALIQAQFACGALGSIHVSRWATGRVNSLYLGIYGTKGAIEIDLDQSWNILQLCDDENKDRAHWYTVHCPQTPSNFQRFVSSIQTGQAEAPDFACGAKIQRVLDACFASASERGAMLPVSRIQ